MGRDYSASKKHLRTTFSNTESSVQALLKRAAVVEAPKLSLRWKDEAKCLRAQVIQLQATAAVCAGQIDKLIRQGEADRLSNLAKEELLNEHAEHEFRCLLEIAPDAMVVVDFDGTIVFLNAHAQELFGYRREELVSRKLKLLMPEWCRAKQEAYLIEFFDSPSGNVNHPAAELFGLRKDGSEFPFEVSLSPLETLAGTLTITAIRDLSARHDHSVQLLRAERLESIGKFAGNIAHDLNNALTPILLSLELLRMQNPRGSELVDTIESGANRSAEMLSQLLVFSKGSFVEPKVIDINEILHGVVDFIRSSFPATIDFREVQANNLYLVSGDATQIHQVLVNLCLNARDAMPSGGELMLEAENVEVDAEYAACIPGAKPGSFVKLVASDTGFGIPRSVMDRIYEPFFTTKGHGKGTGLGLSIVVGIVKSHGGFIVATSEVNKGSSFSVYLPADKSEPPAPGP